MEQAIQYGVDAISQGALYALLALSLALLFSVMRLVNFAHGELIMIAGYTTYLGRDSLPWPLLILVVVIVAPGWGSGGSGIGRRLAKDSPLATDGDRLFAVMEDGRTIVSRKVGSVGGWEPVPHDIEIMQPAGLAAAGGWLYVSDAERAAVVGIPLTEGHSVNVVGPGKIKRPGAIAAADRAPDQRDQILFLADVGAGLIFRVWVDGDDVKYEPIEAATRVSDRCTLSSSGDALVIGDPDDDLLLRLEYARYSYPRQNALQLSIEEKTAPSGSSMPRTAYKGTKPTTDGYPRIDRPVSVANRKGIVYAVSGNQNEVFSTPRWARRPVRSSFDNPPVRQAARIAVTEQSMFVLDAESGDVVQWPRPVPTEFTFEVTAASACMARFYGYLRERGALPTRTAKVSGGSLEKTLKDEHVLRSSWIPALHELMCGLNPNICTGGRLNEKELRGGDVIRIPDLLVESKLVNRRVTLDGTKTVRAYVADSVVSDEFDYARQPKYLVELNRGAAKRLEDEKGTLLDARDGDFVLPKELVRYLAAVPEADVRDGILGEALRELKRGCPGAEINPLEERHAVKSQAGTDWVPVDNAYDHVTKDVIHYDATRAKQVADGEAPFVGVVEAQIDMRHPDFFDQGGNPAFATNEALVAAPFAAFTKRAEVKEDHGTAVAYLIGGRRRRVENGKIAGLAPMARLVEFTDELSSLPAMFADSEYNASMRVVNMSLRTPQDTVDSAITNLLKNNEQTLFVIAAGNNNESNKVQELCNGIHVFPACEHARKNVLVVGATAEDGQTMLSPSSNDEGSHWSPKAVHVVAPGVGFYSAGKDGAYVPVRGTSFATPLVTATAALLVAAGVDDPWAIKQRIIAAADPTDSLRGKVLGGLLNVERTLKNPRLAILIDGSNALSEVKAVTGNHELRIRFNDGSPHTVRLKDILRLTRIGNGPAWRLVYRPTNDAIAVEEGVTATPEGWKLNYLASSGQGPQQIAQLDQFTEYLAAAQ